MASFHFRKGDREYGPVSAQQLVELARSGRLRPTDLIRPDNGQRWVPATQIPGLFASKAAATAGPSRPAPAAPPPPGPGFLEEALAVDATGQAVEDPPPLVPYQPPPMPGPAAAPQAAAGPRTSGLAVAALVLGILGIVTCGLPLASVAAFILGLVAIKRIDAADGWLRGRGMAQAGAILGGIFAGLSVLAIAAWLVIGFLPRALVKTAEKAGGPPKAISQARGIHQSMVIFAQSNNFNLPGLDHQGNPLPDGPATGMSGGGESVPARFYLLVSKSFVPPDWLISPGESQGKRQWTPGSVTRQHYSLAMLDISQPGTGRVMEWRDNANPRGVLLSDRNIGPNPAGATSIWSPQQGPWHGVVQFGDNSAAFAEAPALPTRYAGSSSAQDHLFIDEPATGDAPPGSNALMTDR